MVLGGTPGLRNSGQHRKRLFAMASTSGPCRSSRLACDALGRRGVIARRPHGPDRSGPAPAPRRRRCRPR
jgi:hypothetical protein